MTDNLGKHEIPEIKCLVNGVSNLYLGSAAGVIHVLAESNVVNESDEVLPPVVPHQLVVLTHSEFCCVIYTQQELILAAG